MRGFFRLSLCSNIVLLTVRALSAQQIELTMPFEPGTVVRCTQGPGGTYSHRRAGSAHALDFGSPTHLLGSLRGTPVVAAAGGTAHVYFDIPDPSFRPANCPTATSRSFGNHVTVDHGSGLFTIYAHLESIAENIDGVPVCRGQLLGWVDSTGYSCGDHLHFSLQMGDATQVGPSVSVPINTMYVRRVGTGQAGFLSDSEFVCGERGVGQDYQSIALIDDEPTESILQPGPADGKDVWTTSVYCYCPGGGGPGGGLNNEALVVGGWGDEYRSLIEFDLTCLPFEASSAVLHLFCYRNRGTATTPLYLDRITEFWDWRTMGTGADHDRLWWADRPDFVQAIVGQLPAPTVGAWYTIDITDLYNDWRFEAFPNYGLQLRPVSTGNQWAEFYGSDFTDDPTKRPKLVITPAPSIFPE